MAQFYTLHTICRRGREHTEDAHRRTLERLTEPFVHSRHSSAINAIISLASFAPHFKNINVALRLLSELHRRVLLSLKPAGSHCQPCTAATFNKRANLPDSFQRRWLAKHHIGSLIPPHPQNGMHSHSAKCSRPHDAAARDVSSRNKPERRLQRAPNNT